MTDEQRQVHMTRQNSHKHRRASGQSRESLNVPEIVDTELHCAYCGSRLYIPGTQVPTILQGLQKQGIVGLWCVCNAITLADAAALHLDFKRND